MQEHLAICESCQSLVDSWLEVKVILNKSVSIQPVTGFTERWQARYIEQSQSLEQRRQRQSWWFFLIAATLAGLLFTLLVAQFIASFSSPTEVFVSGVYLFSEAIASLATLQSLLTTLLNTLLLIIPSYWWFLFIGVISGLIIIWLVSLRLVIYPRRISQ
jgi:hypothetical protein